MRGNINKSKELRLLLHSTIPQDKTLCWEWQATLDSHGYGRFGRSPRELAHRVSYRTFVGPIPDGLCVCHTCDNRKCINPMHLWLGTQIDNNRDKVEKGRHRNGMEKLTKETAEEIWKLTMQCVTLKEISLRYGISIGTAQKIKNRKSWHFRN